jgi:hypothetical protein
MDSNPIVNALISLASFAVSIAIPILLPALLRRLKIASDSDLARRLDTAANAAAGLAYQQAAARANRLALTSGLGDPGTHAAAVNAGTNYVVRHLPDAMQRLGVSVPDVAEMVSARLGTLLAADPSVTAGQPIGVPPPRAASIPVEPADGHPTA